MSIVNQFFDFFKQKDGNKEPVVENNTVTAVAENEAPLVVQADDNEVAMVRADEFADSSVTPEEYTVTEDEPEEEEFLEEVRDVGITVDDGDDMSPIIMDAHEEIVLDSNDIDKVLDDPTHKNGVIEYPINIRTEEEELEDEEEIEVL